jgi:hypothetical protein
MQVRDRHGFLGNAWWSWKNAWFLKQDFAQKTRLARRYPLPLGMHSPNKHPTTRSSAPERDNKTVGLVVCPNSL